MNKISQAELFDLSGRVAIVTGGGGVLGSVISRALGTAGVTVAVMTRTPSTAAATADQIVRDGGQAIALTCDVLDREGLEASAQQVLEKFGRVDFVINGAGGNHPDAATSDTSSFFDLPTEAQQWVFQLNLTGTILPCQVFGRIMADRGEGVFVNVSSMSGLRPLTRVFAYSAAKAAVNNFTQWLSVHLAQEYSPGLRVNCIAPGFFLTKQNRFLVLDEKTGEFTPRGKSIVAHTPMGRFGDPEDLVGTVLWLLSPVSRFVTGIVVPVDGGFSAFGGV
jgi:NAD(P)-dependent dehydrogenase (short-subunit alcohol dehydrogenase family)